MSSADQPPEGFMRLYHGGGPGVSEILGDFGPFNLFGGLFASSRLAAARSHGTGSVYVMDVAEDKVLTQQKLNYDVPYEQQIAALRSQMRWLKDDDIDAAYEAVIDDRVDRVDGDELQRIFREDDAGAAGWEAQRIRGLVARALGFDAVEMRDEHGTSFLVLPGVPIAPLPEPDGRAPPSEGRGVSGGMFSVPDASLETLDDVLSAPPPGMLQRAKEWLAGKWQDLRPWALGALPLRDVLDLAGNHIPAAKGYADTQQQMATDRNLLHEEYGAVANDLDAFRRKNPAEAKALSALMNDSTINGTDPSKPYEPYKVRDSKGDLVVATRQVVADRIKALRAQMRGRPGEPHGDKQDEIKQLQAAMSRSRARKDGYPALAARFQALSPEAQQLFTKVRDTYQLHSDRTEQALLDQIDAIEMPGNIKRSAQARIRQQFEDARLQGIYFPLTRNGDYWISATSAPTSKHPKGEQLFVMFEDFAEFSRGEKAIKKAGYKIDAIGRKNSNFRSKDAPSGTFVAETIEMLRKAGVSENALDQYYQSFLKTLPELSMRKHSIHRKKVAGYEVDQIRAFGTNMFHGGHQLPRLRHAHKLQRNVEQMRAQVEDARRAGIDAATANKLDTVMAEIERRHEWVLSPKDSAVANMASAIGFAMYLGATPAAALVNLTQGPMITLPVMAAKYGWDKAGRMLMSTTWDALRSFGNVERLLRTDDERAAYRVAIERGDIQRTAAHNLAGIAEGSELQANPTWARVMRGVSFLFQRMEMINRQAAFLAAYRIAKSEGQSEADAIKYGSDIINQTHFDFSNANRARYIQSAPAKVLFMFRQYALHTSLLLGRETYRIFRGETPEVRQLARRKISGILGMSALFSGAMGLPFMGIATMVANALQATFGDDDEPWDFNTEVRNFLADHLGPDAARWVADGAASRAGADIASRVSMSQMWFRDADRELEGMDAYHNALEQVAGPIGGLVKNFYVGKKQIDDGHVWRGVETMMPKAIKDAMKSLRFATEGVNTLRGDPVMADITAPELLVQLMGFSPTRLAEQYRVNRAVKNYEAHILDRRQSLLSALAMAVRLEDDEMRMATLEKIQAFNRKFPELALSPRSIRQSLRARARYSAQAENGIVLNKRIAERARAEAGFTADR